MGEDGAVGAGGDGGDAAGGVAAEQRYIDLAYGFLDAMRDRAVRLFEEYRGTDPDLEHALARRIHLLRDTGRALCFGRLDAAGDPGQETGGDTWYVGRRHVEDGTGEPV